MGYTFNGYRRPDGQVGIRNYVGIIPSVTCASDVASAICRQVQGCVTFPHHQGCCQMPPDLERVTDTLISLGKSPNLGAVLIVSLGCEGTDVERLYKEVSATGKHVEIIRIQELGGVSNAIQKGTDIARNMAIEISGRSVKKQISRKSLCPLNAVPLIQLPVSLPTVSSAMLLTNWWILVQQLSLAKQQNSLAVNIFWPAVPWAVKTSCRPEDLPDRQ